MVDPHYLHYCELSVIIDRCCEETKKYYEQGDSQDAYCLELFRRALVQRNRHAWEALYQQYAPLICHWLKFEPVFQHCSECEEYFVNRALERMWQAVRGRRFERFESLGSVLQYLKLCLKTSLIDYSRTEKLRTLHIEDLQPTVLVADTLLESELVRRSETKQFWRLVRDHLRSDQEQAVVYESFLLELKPAQIFARHRHLFDDVSNVYKTKRNVLKRLERSNAIQQFLR